MKYLRPRHKTSKIRVSPNLEITVPMFNVVRVDDRRSDKGEVLDSEVTIMATTGAEMLYQRKPKMIKRRYIIEMLKDERHFHITDNYKFTQL